ncbi:hypothetical protein BAUCODRAFT_125417 [Baudoinia panamericana UAMH 10762]|uniref:Ketoreductase (KR) domain-containing protein n=1 Tax=Baudoinia panamericana (strain UAMH 10762) TaxID=717646 RepID=M2MAT1_BAUPA|nr:uncharacterized protein BAUCODRAFT_125417 [Baudoinia panamericana UAMH 10762]EMC93566.1 hypothetical protein BAUCODRAFT_125417 [Baudoinia panamericana UAMH 10762]
MVKYDIIQARATALVKSRPLVAVFVGGTKGIGEYTIRTLARTHGSDGQGLRVYIVGRNADAANKIITECQTSCPTGDFRFVKATDLRLLRDVDQCSNRITQMERDGEGLAGEPARIDLLYLSQDLVKFGDPEYTSEGLEVSMSLLYYSRIRFITNLMPLLLASSQPAHVISIYAAGLETWGTLFRNDLALTKDPKQHYSFLNCRTHVIRMKTMYFERLAEQHAGKLSLVHVFPGLVIGPSFQNPSFPLWFKILWFLLEPIARLLMNTAPEVSGMRHLFLATSRYPARGQVAQTEGDTDLDVAVATDGVRGGGAYSCGQTGEINNIQQAYVELRKKDFADQVWEHTHRVFSVIEAGKKFEE